MMKELWVHPCTLNRLIGHSVPLSECILMNLPEVGPPLMERTNIQFGKWVVSSSACWFDKGDGAKTHG